MIKEKERIISWDCWFSVTSWLIWKERNDRVFERHATSPTTIIHKAALLFKECTLFHDGIAKNMIIHFCQAFTTPTPHGVSAKQSALCRARACTCGGRGGERNMKLPPCQHQPCRARGLGKSGGMGCHVALLNRPSQIGSVTFNK